MVVTFFFGIAIKNRFYFLENIIFFFAIFHEKHTFAIEFVAVTAMIIIGM